MKQLEAYTEGGQILIVKPSGAAVAAFARYFWKEFLRNEIERHLPQADVTLERVTVSE